MRILTFGLVVSAAAACCSCSLFSSSAEVNYKSPSSDEPSSTVTETSRKNGIAIFISAGPELNSYQSRPHALHLCIYQLKDPNGFNQLVEEKDGIPKLLECSRFDGTVVSAKRLAVQPGQEVKDIRDKAEGARYIGIATGYYGTGRRKLTHIVPLSNGFFSSGIAINLKLGPHEITGIQVK